jgi:hypothetical protein
MAPLVTTVAKSSHATETGESMISENADHRAIPCHVVDRGSTHDNGIAINVQRTRKSAS